MIRTALVIGSGGREHALAWKLSQDVNLQKIIVVPGNDGMPESWERWPCQLSAGSLSDRQAEFKRLAQKARSENVDLVVVGPDNPLADGIVDEWVSEGLCVFGPTAAAAQIEASKAFAKEVMQSAGVPTADFRVAQSLDEAIQVIEQTEWPGGWVIKADGLALGKGVHVCSTRAEAITAARVLFSISGRLIIEERLTGEEISWMAFCDGTNCALLDPAQDHKRLLDGDQGPNTGGMGAYSPVPRAQQASLRKKIREQVFLPTLREMKKRGCEFRGLLFAGLMVDFEREKFWVLEFNARFGDPETQVLMARMQGSLAVWCQASAQGKLDVLESDVSFESDTAVVVVAAAKGYPDQPVLGDPIEGTQDQWIFYAGVKRDGTTGQLKTAGGRVLGVMGMGESLSLARDRAYVSLQKIQIRGMQYRRDIGAQGMRS